ncbi:MAG: ABC transporter ATP-binding protein [Thermoleophilia bacterium]|nr:ABC transporter ATP-binding protein [Thermoleophilia bacterium]
MPASPKTAVAIRGLTVVRGGSVVLPDLSADVAAGSVTGLLGPSGSGKSTLMRAIVGVQRIASGTVEVLGLPAGDAAVRARVGYVTQAASVYDDLTVVENLRYFARVLSVPANEVDRAVTAVGLEHHEGRMVRTLSGGERGRVSLAAALLPRPEVLIMDEPTVGLDPVLRRQLWDTFHSLAGDGVALLVSSHVMEEAAECDTLLLMRDGHIIASEAPATLLARTGTAGVGEAFLALIGEKEATA